MANPRELLSLRELYQSGALTEQEYIVARRQLLGYRPRLRRDPETGGRDLPILFALAALALVSAAIAVYFVAFMH
ncbi:MAG TPA: SHOCT domain-containing protein [Jatrophihabitantaceae bacterium]